MRNLALSVMLLFAATVVGAEDAPTPVWTGFVFAHTYQQEGDDRPSLTKLRLKLTRTGGWGGHLDFDAADTHNRLQQFYIARNLENDSFRLGRVFLGACFSTPPPFLNRTARYPQAAFTIAAYGYGFQWEHRAKGWTFISDITGRSGKNFDDGKQFDGLEFSTRAAHTLRPSLDVAVTGQFSKEFVRLAFDFEHRFHKFGSIGGLYYSDEEIRKRGLVGFVRTEYLVIPWLRPHLQFDARADGNNVWASGVGLGDPTRSFYAVVDYESGYTGVGLVARAQFRLNFSR